MNSNASHPLPVLIVSFLAMESIEQLERMGECEVDSDAALTPVEMLMNAADSYAKYFFDFFAGVDPEDLPVRLYDALQEVASSPAASIDDFSTGQAWDSLRVVCRSMLLKVGICGVEIPRPLPLQMWVHQF
jgi:hypothetical protein